MISDDDIYSMALALRVNQNARRAPMGANSDA